MRPNSTAMAKLGSSRMPGASNAITPGMPSISSTEKGTSRSSSPAWARGGKARAASRPCPCSSRENSGTKAAEKAPSANRRRKKFGSLKATKKASATAPEPSTADSTMSRMKPTTRLSRVNPPTVATARPRLMMLGARHSSGAHEIVAAKKMRHCSGALPAMSPFSLPEPGHRLLTCPLSGAAGDVMAGINRYHGRSPKRAGFLLSHRQAEQRLAILGGKLLVVGDDLGEFVGRQHAFQLGKSLRRALLDDVEHDVDALAAIALDDACGQRQAAFLVAFA